MSFLKLHKGELVDKAEIVLPLSKSIQNRALIVSFMSAGKLSYNQLSDADDAILLEALLAQIGKHDSKETLNLDCKNAGTVMRFLTAVCSCQKGSFILQGSDRMHQRPIDDLVNPLRKMGADMQYVNQDGFPPLKIVGSELSYNDILDVNADKSSQFVSAIALIAPSLKGGLKLAYKKEMASYSYLKMTLELLKLAGVHYEEKDSYMFIPPTELSGEIDIERDWSSAAFFYSLVALSDNQSLIFPGLQLESLQGDRKLVDIFKSLGVETKETDQGIEITKAPLTSRHFSYDFSDCPDLALPVIACCAGLNMMASFKGLRNLKYKESNRLQALISELAKLGYDLREISDDEAVLINDCKFDEIPNLVQDICIDTYEDHRMAMSIAPLVIVHNNLSIENPNVVEKSFPKFWEELIKTGISLK